MIGNKEIILGKGGGMRFGWCLMCKGNNNRMKTFMISGVVKIILVAASLLLSVSCEDDAAQAVAVHGDYYPLKEGSWWKYVTKFRCHFPDTLNTCYDTAYYTAGGDALPWGDEEYKPLSASHGTFKWIKKINDEYYAWAAYIPEHKFLDAGLPVNGSWATDNGLAKEEFTITEVNTIKNVQGKVYNDVIAVRKSNSWRNQAGQYEEYWHSYNYYAKDVGEIYSIYPATLAREGGDIEVSLVDYFIAQ